MLPRLCCGLLLLTIHIRVDAGLLPDAQREELVKRVLAGFWGQATLSNGQLAQPSSEAERTTVPIAKPVVNRALDAGEVSGLSEWCGLDWQRHYLSLTKAARAKGFNDKQVAFFSFLHGAAQGRVASAMAKSQSCQAHERQKVQQMLQRSTTQALEGL